MASRRTLLIGVLLSAGAACGAEHHGQVTSSGLPVPGATVRVRQSDTHVATTTDERGAYSFSGLADGLWTVEIEMSGFAKLAGEVRVSEKSAGMEWDLKLLPADQSGAEEAQLPSDAARRLNPAPLGTPRDELQELAQSANTALLVSGRTRRAAKKNYNGSASLSLDNSVWDARAFSLTGQKQEKPSFARAQGNASFGGSFRKSTHFTLGHSAGRSRKWSSFTSTMPSALERSGDFSRSVAQGPVSIYDPLAGQPFPGNRIPSSRIDSAALGLLKYISLPNQQNQVQNYQFVRAVPMRYDSVNANLNHNLGSKDHLSWSLSRRWDRGDSPQLMGFTDNFQEEGWDANLSWTHNLTSRMVSTTSLMLRRDRSQVLPYFAYRENVAAALGITGTATDPLNWGPPHLSFTNFGGLSDENASRALQQTATASESIAWSGDKHNLTFGIEYTRQHLNRIQDFNARGSFTFTGIATSAFNTAGEPVAGTGFDFADFLLGLPQSSSVRFGGGDNYFRSANYGLFMQDDWRMASRFTLNFGVRYDYATPVSEKYSRLSNLRIASGFSAAESLLAPGMLIEPDRNNVSPRVGIAWRPSAQHSTVVHAGYGWYFNASVYQALADKLAQQPPFATSSLLASRADRVLTIRNGFGSTLNRQGNNTYAVDPRYRIGYAQSWNLAIQQDLGGSLVGEISYRGTKGTRLDILRVANRLLNVSPFVYESSDGNSIFHSGSLKLTRRFNRGVSAQLQYTFAKSIDNASSVIGSGGPLVQDPFNFAAERGLSPFDNRHAVNANWRLSMRNWTLASTITYRSGRPFTPTVLGNRADIAGTGITGTTRADATGLPVRSDEGFFNLAAFSVPMGKQFGNAGRATIPGPAQFMMNASISRTLPLGEQREIELRLDANNVLNRVNITGFGTVVNASAYGRATGAGTMRSLTANLRFRF